MNGNLDHSMVLEQASLWQNELLYDRLPHRLQGLQQTQEGLLVTRSRYTVIPFPRNYMGKKVSDCDHRVTILKCSKLEKINLILTN